MGTGKGESHGINCMLFHYSKLLIDSLLSVLYALAYYLTSAFVLSNLLFRSFCAIAFHKLCYWNPAKALKLLAHALCFSAFVPMFPHLEVSDSCLSHCPRISICCLSFKTQFKSQFLQGSSFDHLGWKEPYLSLNFQRIPYGSYHILLCIT